MNLAAARALILKHEGIRLFPYDDATGQPLKSGDVLKGKITIGVGHNLSDRGITQEQADDWLDDEIARCVNDLCINFPWFVGLSDNRQNALIDLRFNLGPSRFRKFAPTLALLAAGEFNSAAAHIEGSALPLNRKKDLARLIREG